MSNPHTAIDIAQEAGKKAVEELVEFRHKAREQIRGGTPKGYVNLTGEQLRQFIDMKINQQVGFVADEAGNPVPDQNGQQQLVEYLPGQGWVPMKYRYGPDWWTVMQQKTTEGGREWVSAYNRATRRAIRERADALIAGDMEAGNG